MSERALIRIRQESDEIDWLALDDRGNRVGQPTRGTPSDVAERVESRPVTILVPGEAVGIHFAEVPTRKVQRVRQAVPFLLEERLADDIDRLHFAVSVDQKGPVAVAVVDRADMDAWTGTLADAGLSADRILPEFLAVPWQSGTWTVLAEADRIHVRRDRHEGFTAEPELAATLLETLLANPERFPRPDSVRLYLPDTDAESCRHLVDVLKEHDLPVQEDETAHGLLVHAAPALAGGVDLNLAQGPYRYKRETTGWWRPWLPAASVAVAWMVMALAIEFTGYFQLQARADELRSELETHYRRALPDAREFDPAQARLRVRRALEGMASGGDAGTEFFDIFGATARGVADIDDARLNQVAFNGGELDISVLVPDAQKLDAIQQKIASAGPYQVDIQAANNRGERVEGRLKIAPAGGS